MKLKGKYIVPNLDTPKVNELPKKYRKIVTQEEWVGFVTHTATDEYKVVISHLHLSLYVIS